MRGAKIDDCSLSCCLVDPKNVKDELWEVHEIFLGSGAQKGESANDGHRTVLVFLRTAF